MEIPAKINELVEKIKNDKNLMSKFQKNPSAVVKELIGIDLPADQLEKVVDGVKAKVSVDKIGDTLGGLFGKKK